MIVLAESTLVYTACAHMYFLVDVGEGLVRTCTWQQGFLDSKIVRLESTFFFFNKKVACLIQRELQKKKCMIEM